MNSQSEPEIIINGTTLTDAQVMTLRCACSNFGSDLLENGLGNDESGRAMTAGYLARLRELDKLLHLHGFVNGMVASHLLCHSGTINRHSLNGALLS